MSWEANAYVLNLGRNHPDLTSNEMLVLLMVSARHNHDQGCAWPRLANLAADCHLSTRTVARIINALETKRMIWISTTIIDGRRSLAFGFVGFDAPRGERHRIGGRPGTDDTVSSLRQMTPATFTDDTGDIPLPILNRHKEPAVTRERAKPPGDEPPDPARSIYDHFKARIQPASRVAPLDAIRRRLKTFTADDLRLAIDHFAADTWWMTNCGFRGASWFFDKPARIETWINMTPRSGPEEPRKAERYVYDPAERNHIDPGADPHSNITLRRHPEYVRRWNEKHPDNQWLGEE